MLALLNSDLSLLVRSHPGTGKSLATVLFLLNNTAPSPLKQDAPFITNLLIVPTPDLAIQYYNLISKLIENTPLDIRNVAQYAFRSDAEGEEKQLELLQSHPGPHIFIGTPTRILDILSSKSRGLLPLSNVCSITLDEADQLLPSQGLYNKVKMTRKVAKHKPASIAQSPTQILLDHVVRWRDSAVKQNSSVFIPLKFLMESSTASSHLKIIASRSNWIAGRPMLRLGLDAFGGGLRNRGPNDVCNYFITFNPFLNKLEDTDYDVSSILPTFDENTFNVVREFNEQRVKDHIKEYSALNQNQRQNLISLYAAALARMMKADAEKDSSKTRRRALVVVPEAFSIASVLSILKEQHGITGAYSKTFGNTSGVFFQKDTDSKPIAVDTNTLFTKPIEEGDGDKGLPDVLVYRARGTVGIDFPGLDRIYALSWDSILSSKLYLSLAGRCRAAPIRERTSLENSGFWKPPSDPEQGKFVVISTVDETNDMRYKMLLNVSMSKIGIAPQKFF